MSKEIHYKPTTEESFDGFKMKFYFQDEASNLDIPRYLHDEAGLVASNPIYNNMIKKKIGQCCDCPEGVITIIVEGWSTRDRKRCGKHAQERKKRELKEKRKKEKDDDQEFYEMVWATRPHVCEETGVRLPDKMSRIYISHILSKGAHPSKEWRHNNENVNILCPEAHQNWESGGRRTTMRVFYKNYLYMVSNGYVPSDEEERAYQVWQEKNKKNIQ